MVSIRVTFYSQQLEVMLTSAMVVFLPMGSEFSITTGEPVSVLYLQDHWENNIL